jgi:dephospho-CoA kinase
MATKMIRSQLSVEEKKGYCDLVIDNSGSLEETRRRVEELWSELTRIQRERIASRGAR